MTINTKSWLEDGNKKYEVLHRQIKAAGWIARGHVFMKLRPTWVCENCKKQNTFTVWKHADGRQWCNDCVVKDARVRGAA